MVAVSTVAHADPEEVAANAAEEANLASNAPRDGFMFAAAVGAGLTMGDGVGRGPAISFRIGHTATRTTELTFEITGGSLLHQPPGSGVRHNDFIGAMAGAQHYLAASFWVRGAAGPVTYTEDLGTDQAVHGGIGGTVGFGIDLARWHYLVLGIETFGTVAAVATRGGMFNSGLCLGLSYY